MALGLTRNRCLEITGLTKHQFYHAGSGKQSGRFGSKTTRHKDPLTGCISMVDNMVVVDKIVAIKLEPDLHHWYRMITRSLQLAGFYINHKKVYRLMSAYSLLEEPRKRVGRNFVTFGRMTPRGPLRSFEVEINYFWIQGAQKRASVLTILDNFTRYALKWSVGYDMKAVQVKKAWEELIENFLQPAEIRDKVVEVIIGDNNDRQFTTNILSELFRKNQMNHLFTYPHTPKENDCVENFHSVMGKALEKAVFTDLNSLEVRLQKFYANYNDHRCHSATVGLPPSKFWALYELNKIEVIVLSKGRIRFKLKVPYQDIIHLSEIGKYEHRQIPT